MVGIEIRVEVASWAGVRGGGGGGCVILCTVNIICDLEVDGNGMQTAVTQCGSIYNNMK